MPKPICIKHCELDITKARVTGEGPQEWRRPFTPIFASHSAKMFSSVIFTDPELIGKLEMVKS